MPSLARTQIYEKKQKGNIQDKKFNPEVNVNATGLEIKKILGQNTKAISCPL